MGVVVEWCCHLRCDTIHTYIQPTPVPNDRVFQRVFASQAVQVSGQREDSTTVRGPGGLSTHIEATTPFGRGITLPLGPARGPQVPMDISSSGSMPPGGLQQARADTPKDRPILDMPREQAIPPPSQNAASRVVYAPDTGSVTYYGSDASAALLFRQTHQTAWARSWHDTSDTQ